MRSSGTILIQSLQALRSRASRFHEKALGHLETPSDFHDELVHKIRQIEGMILALQHLSRSSEQVPTREMLLLYRALKIRLKNLERQWGQAVCLARQAGVSAAGGRETSSPIGSRVSSRFETA